jgi:hypothetical protein
VLRGEVRVCLEVAKRKQRIDVILIVVADLRQCGLGAGVKVNWE